tara:strand:+ start:44981 stop:45757 length:777 start_codon:yes stop_codon:yes gene_type:complete
MLSLVFSIGNLYYNIVTVAKSVISNYFSKTSEEGLVENNIFLLGEHILFSCLGAYLFWEREWLWDITMMWEENLTFDISFYYVLYTLRYLVQIQMMTGEEKDYQSMMTHHISTVLLLTLSFLHYHRIGVIIALSHDMTDLMFLPAKLCHKFYETRKIKVLNLLSYLYFIFFLVLFFLTRILLNTKIILHIFDTVLYPTGEFQLYNPSIYNETYVLFMLLFVNLGIQFFWQIMIVKFAYNLAIGSKPKDEKGDEYFKQE